jgi:hypothetical protein
MMYLEYEMNSNAYNLKIKRKITQFLKSGQVEETCARKLQSQVLNKTLNWPISP